jgi:endonuclease/exonuclease/phosphatase family metal-dependent hydrolase
MRLISWNLAHQCREDPIPPAFLEAVALLSPDVLSLNEYVHGDTRASFAENLNALGLRYLSVSQRLNGNNQVLVASRYPMTLGDLRGPPTSNMAGESNFLHVCFPTQGLEFVGLRAPSYSGAAQSDYWQALAGVIRGAAHRRIVFMGDLNTDPDRKRHRPARHLREFAMEGWSVPSPAGEWSFISKSGIGTRIDHAIAAPALTLSEASYITCIGSLTLAAPNRTGAVSDHAPLLLRLSAA